MSGKDLDKLKSFLGTQSELEGELRIKGVLRLDGTVKGKIVADQVILSETAYIKGEILAKKIIVGGTVEGTLRASTLLEIGSKGSVQGEIFAEKLVVLEGGTFNGRIDMRSSKVNVLDFEPRSQVVSGSR
ncbi:MAG: polymer-forming cytoskeletal protein [Acidobacteriota bacterium]|nr:polymer-forming cytoskeletal protein [Acidobacteriota bacterium]